MWMWLAHRWPLSAWACGEDATRWAITMAVGIAAGNLPFGVTGADRGLTPSMDETWPEIIARVSAE